MTSLLRHLCALLALLGIHACDSSNLAALKPGVATDADVRAKMGEPGAVWPEADGGVTWEYSRQPNGTECFMLTLGPEQNGHRLLQKVEQVITDAHFATIQRGWSKDQVRRLLGQPRSIQFYPLKREEVWDWKVGREPSGAERYFNVHLDENGQVISTSASVQSMG